MSMSTKAKKPTAKALQVQPRPAFKVRDLALAELGRKEIRLAEDEMPGLMALRAKYGKDKPLAVLGAKGHQAGHQDADRARRQRALGLLQHLQHPGQRRRGG